MHTHTSRFSIIIRLLGEPCCTDLCLSSALQWKTCELTDTLPRGAMVRSVIDKGSQGRTLMPVCVCVCVGQGRCMVGYLCGQPEPRHSSLLIATGPLTYMLLHTAHSARGGGQLCKIRTRYIDFLLRLRKKRCAYQMMLHITCSSATCYILRITQKKALGYPVKTLVHINNELMKIISV